MKVGSYCGLSLEKIIDIKQKEEKKVGKFYWGYSGVFCRPHVVNNLVRYADDEKIYVLFTETKSKFTPDTHSRFTMYSKDKDRWSTLPKDVLLVGNKSKDHFAITAKNLKKVDFDIDLNNYCTLKGVFPNDSQRFDKYFRYRVDKACGVYLPNSKTESKKVNIKYVSELVKPYSLYIK
jgi:hypothetical protein